MESPENCSLRGSLHTRVGASHEADGEAFGEIEHSHRS
jgi:hypothetical protein